MRTIVVYEIGDRVMDSDGGRAGVVVEIGCWDSFLECLRYKVQQDDGPNHWRNGSNLIPA